MRVRTASAVGILLALAIIVAWSGFSGRTGLVLAALVSPSSLVQV